VEEYFCDHAK